MAESKKLSNAHKTMIYDRLLLEDEKVQSLVKPKEIIERSFNYIASYPHSKDFSSNISAHYSLTRPINAHKSLTRLMGIDLGESTCVVCIFRNGRAELVKIDQDYAMPTVISFVEKEPIIGTIAMRHFKKQPGSVLTGFKQILRFEEEQHFLQIEELLQSGICETPKQITSTAHMEGTFEHYSSIEIYQILLQKLKIAASEFQSDLNQGKPVNHAVITISSLSNYKLVADIRRASELVGIKIIDIIEETYADLLYFKNDLPQNQCVVIVNIGGGTGHIRKFVIAHDYEKKVIDDTGYKILNISGRQIDELLMDNLRQLLFKNYGISTDNLNDYKILAEIERIKTILSFDETAYLDLPSTLFHMENSPEVSRKWFEQEVLEPLLSFGSVKTTVTDFMKNVKSAKVFLVGGTCRIPYIQNYFKSIFEGAKIVIRNNLQEITATGALIHGLQVLND